MSGVWLAGMAVIAVPLAIAKAYAPSGWFNVASSSMEPTLRLGEDFLVDPAYYHGHGPSRGDVVVYPLPSDPKTLYLKRIVALSGDHIAIKDGIAVVNGQLVSEPYIRVLDGRSARTTTPLKRPSRPGTSSCLATTEATVSTAACGPTAPSRSRTCAAA